MSDGLIEILFRPGRSLWIRRDTACNNELFGFDAVGVLDVQSPDPTVALLDIGDGSIESSFADQVMVLGKVVQVAMDGVSRDVTVRSQTLLLHRVEGVFEEAMVRLSEEIGIDSFFAPDTTN